MIIDVTPSACEFPLLIKQLLITPIARASTREIVSVDGLRYGYPELVRRIARLANVLDDLGVSPEATVAILDWDGHRYLEGYFAIPMTARVMQTVNIRLSAEQILYTLNHAQAEVLIVHPDFLPLLAPILDGLETVRTIIGIDDFHTPDPRYVGSYETLMAAASDHYDFPDFDERTRATIFYTSGTTGLPKGVYYSHRQIVLHTMALLATYGTAPAQGRVSEDDVYMPITPMFHAHAWGWPYAATLLGMKQVYLGRYTPQKVIETIRQEKASFSHCVTTLLQMVLNEPSAAGLDLRGFKFLIGGSALPVGLARQALERGIDVFTGYGMSETGPMQVINHLSREEAATDLDTQAVLRTRGGRPAILCDVRIVDDEVNVLPRDGKRVGEIVFRSPWNTQGYFGNPDTSEALWRGGWMHSGDLGVMHPDGSLQLTDRIKDVIKSGGEWISSLDLESLTSRHPAVAEVAFIGVPDATWGERPMALIVLRDDDRASCTGDTIREHLQAFAEQGAIPRYAVPERVLFVDALEKTSVGKLDKKALRARYVGPA
ncbi:fatty acid--CoA ligase [Nevskia ramosa]|uniref:fatty acid--CoA ligase n=1 Tax=Nevskia ramosa TaxID=64002 RepID=UPI0003B43D65|nr:fatty acid--CoA ligase [Nevskia ramosa]